MKGTWKGLLSVTLCIAIILGIFPLNIFAEENSSLILVYTEGNMYAAQAREVLRLVNEERQEQGLSPLVMTNVQEKIAQQRAMEVVANFSHTRPNGASYLTLAEEHYLGYKKAGENYAVGQDNAAEVMESWMNSEEQRENILNPSFTHIGIGCFESDGAKYWVQFFTEDPSDTSEAADVSNEKSWVEGKYPLDLSVVDDCGIEFWHEEESMPLGGLSAFDLVVYRPSALDHSKSVFGMVVFSDDSIMENGTVSTTNDAVQVWSLVFSVADTGELGESTLTVKIGNLTAQKLIHVTCFHDPDRQGTHIERLEPTCREEGCEREICSACGTVISTTVIPKLEHPFEWTFVEPTCVEEQRVEGYCRWCGIRSTNWYSPLHHDEEAVYIQATCTEDGKEGEVCTRCDEVLCMNIIPALGHDWSEWTSVREAAEDADGMMKRVCRTCHSEEKILIPKLSDTHEHIFSTDGNIVKEPTCTQDGLIEYTCSYPECDAKKTEIVSAFGHSEGESCTIESTCTTEGKVFQKCENCGTLLTENFLICKRHNWDEGEVANQPSCTKTGRKVYTCSMCQMTYEEEIPALGHDPEEIVTEPTCTKEGKRELVCRNCGDILQSRMSFNLFGHRWSLWSVEKAASWNEEGVKIRICSRCEERETIVIPKLSEGHQHDFSGQEIIMKASTCTEEGSKVTACSNPSCDVTRTEAVPALGHEEEVHVTQPTCMENGLREVSCERCGETISEEVIPSTGHDWNEWNIEKAASWDEEGLLTRSCSRCDEKETEVIPKLSDGHQHAFSGQETMIKEATCTEEGIKAIACIDPGCDVIRTEAVPALGHEEEEHVMQPTSTKDGLREIVCSRCNEKLSEEVLPGLSGSSKEEKPEQVPATGNSGTNAVKTGDSNGMATAGTALIGSAVSILICGWVLTLKKRKINR